MLSRCFLCSEYTDAEFVVRVGKLFAHKECIETMAYHLTHLEMKMEYEMASFFRRHPEMKGGKNEKKA